jgi:AcrR family transcriptional regulator
MSGEASKRGRGRPRRSGADEEILTVTMAMLGEKGYRELTVDAVAERSGVAKTTIYRRWPSKGALVAAALAPAVESAPPPKGNSIAGDVTHILQHALTILRLGGDLRSDPELCEVMRTAIEPHRERILTLLSHASLRAEASLVTDLLIGALLFGRTEIEEMVRVVL